MKHWLPVGAVVLLVAVAIWLYLTQPEISALVTPAFAEVQGIGDRMSGVYTRAKPVAVAIWQNCQDLPAPEEFAGAELALLRNESQFIAGAYNYKNPNGKGYLSGVWDGGELPPAVFAAGVAQAVPDTRNGWGLSLLEAFRVEPAVQASVAKLNGPHWRRIMAALPGAPLQLRAALLYLGHAEGGGPLYAALAVRPSSWSEVTDAVRAAYGNKGRRPASGIYNSASNMWRIGGYAAWWVGQLSDLLGADVAPAADDDGEVIA